ncbi:hypothetical protein [Spiroplasma endosymbiont of Polydrusus formosus]|uniref:hypothetical protein n=1 Tax=Spiroplasma endosymbiont of Polydrusus formosus TaxID=3139326 RepID=UPI0035B55746
MYIVPPPAARLYNYKPYTKDIIHAGVVQQPLKTKITKPIQCIHTLEDPVNLLVLIKNLNK